MKVILLGYSLSLCLFGVAGASGLAQSSSTSPASTSCPWITEGSAAKALGGEVTLVVNLSGADEGSCNFFRKQEPKAFLKIEVSKSVLSSCSADSTKLRGVGNEAMRCAPAGSGDQTGEMISGRVRDLHFVLTFQPLGIKSPANSAGTQDDVLEQIAEQVAGNLF